MLYYKDPFNNVHALDQPGFEHLLPPGCQPIDEEEALELLAPNVHTMPEEQLVAELSSQIQARLDNFAATRKYDSIMSACTYVTSSVPKFKAEADYCVAVRDATWATAYTILGQVLGGQRPRPASIEDFVAELPPLAWPN